MAVTMPLLASVRPRSAEVTVNIGIAFFRERPASQFCGLGFAREQNREAALDHPDVLTIPSDPFSIGPRPVGGERQVRGCLAPQSRATNDAKLSFPFHEATVVALLENLPFTDFRRAHMAKRIHELDHPPIALIVYISCQNS
jgi:hypothetical protein